MLVFWKNPYFATPVLLFYVVGLSLTLAWPHGREILIFNELRHEPLNSGFIFLTHLGEVWAYLAASVVLAFIRPKLVLPVLFIGLLVLPISYILKDVIGFDRPTTWFENHGAKDLIVFVPGVEVMSGQASFPSGHTMGGFALYSLLASLLPLSHRRWAAAFAVLAGLVGLSRIFLVQHFLIDVLAGAALGMALAWAVLGIIYGQSLPGFRPTGPSPT